MDTLLLLILRVLTFGLGVLILFSTLLSALRTFVLPRSANDQLTRSVFQITRWVFARLVRRRATYEQRDRLMAYYAPVSLFSLPLSWIIFVLSAYTLMFWAVGDGLDPWQALLDSGSAFFTLGFAPVDKLPWIGIFMTFSAATIGLALIALLISYLPAIYSSFERREQAVTLLEVWAGTPPSPVTIIIRAQRIDGMDELTNLWNDWRYWFADLEESHTSQGALSFFRSPRPERSWVSAAGTLLDAAALIDSTVDIPRRPQPQLCIRSGYLALRAIADFFNIEHDPAPDPTDPISLSRAEYDAACAEMELAGVLLKADREQAWRDFAGWRVNYDRVLHELAALTMSPPAYWLPTQPLSDLRSVVPRRHLTRKAKKGAHRK